MCYFLKILYCLFIFIEGRITADVCIIIMRDWFVTTSLFSNRTTNNLRRGNGWENGVRMPSYKFHLQKKKKTFDAYHTEVQYVYHYFAMGGLSVFVI